METITLGLFHSQESAENAINELSENGIALKNISIVMSDQITAKEVCENTGAILCALIGLSLPKEDASIYESDIQSGGILLSIPTPDISETIRKILESNNASQVKSVNRASL